MLINTAHIIFEVSLFSPVATYSALISFTLSSSAVNFKLKNKQTKNLAVKGTEFHRCGVLKFIYRYYIQDLYIV